MFGDDVEICCMLMFIARGPSTQPWLCPPSWERCAENLVWACLGLLPLLTKSLPWDTRAHHVLLTFVDLVWLYLAISTLG